MADRSIWENRVYGYEEYRSNLSEQEYTVRLYTYFEFNNAFEYTDVTFEHVAAHHVAHLFLGAQLQKVDEESVASFLDEVREEWTSLPPYDFIKHRLDSGDYARFRQDEGLRAYSITAAFGLLGWVFARGVSITERSERKLFGLER